MSLTPKQEELILLNANQTLNNILEILSAHDGRIKKVELKLNRAGHLHLVKGDATLENLRSVRQSLKDLSIANIQSILDNVLDVCHSFYGRLATIEETMEKQGA